MGDRFTELLSDYIDDEDVPAAERRRIERHLGGCVDCRATLAELRQVADRGRALPDSAPDRDLWPGVAARIAGHGSRPGSQRRAAAQAFRRRFSFTLPQLAAAALALMVLSGGTVWLARVGSPGTDFEPLSAQVDPPPMAPDRLAAPGDDAAALAASELERSLGAGRVQLDPETVAVLQASLAVANQAIVDCQRALAADSSNPRVAAQLASARRLKLMLLRHAADLTSERP